MSWVEIKNSGGRLISDSGEIRKGNKNLKISTKKNGYKYVAINRVSKFYVHRLVAEAFIPNPEDKPQVNHKDGNKANNHVSNLEWVTPSENMLHSFSSGINISRKGENVSCSKLTNEDVIEIRLLSYLGATNRTLADEFNHDISSIRKIIKRQIWRSI